MRSMLDHAEKAGRFGHGTMAFALENELLRELIAILI
jgi:hypothetical protein